MVYKAKAYMLVIIFAGLMVLPGCFPKASPEAVELSQYLGEQTVVLKELHYNLIDKWVAAKKKVVDEIINNHFLPKVIQDSSAVLEKYKKENEQKYLNGLILIMSTIAGERVKLYQQIEAAEKDIKTRLDKRYAILTAANAQLTAYLKSITNLDSERRGLLEDLGKATGIDLKDAEEKLDGELKKLSDFSKDLIKITDLIGNEEE